VSAGRVGKAAGSGPPPGLGWEVLPDPPALARRAADLLAEALTERPALVLVLPTGRTPLGLYDELVRRSRQAPGLLAGATVINLDEFVGLPAAAAGSFAAYMEGQLFGRLAERPARCHILDGTAGEARRRRHGRMTGSFEEALAEECARYETVIREAGGLDLTFLGMGANGHLAFNEPGSPFDGRTQVVALTPETRRANAYRFPDPEAVPRRGITVGIGTILESRRLILLAQGEEKAPAVARLAGGRPDEAFPASALHLHPRVTVLVDRAATVLADALLAGE
jgi:glucosamine-6-phosphate deaminase